jgi:hypothetical protein
VAHVGSILNLLLGQLRWKVLASSFGKLESTTRAQDSIVDIHCAILVESIPLPVGLGSQDVDLSLEDENLDVCMDAVEEVDKESQSYDEET